MASASDDNTPRDVSRRNLFKQVGPASAAVLAGPPLVSQSVMAQHTAQGNPVASPPEALETLTAAEADILEAIVARLIPSDQNDPGATEARAAHYIDRALAGPLRTSRDAYAAGLAAVDAYALSSKGANFAKLSPLNQDAVLTDIEKNVATGFAPNAASFFNLVRAHTIQGTFCDPYYGGNANFVGWDLIGYPGIRMTVTEAEQRLKAPPPVHRSAYDDPMFTMRGGSVTGGDHDHRP